MPWLQMTHRDPKTKQVVESDYTGKMTVAGHGSVDAVNGIVDWPDGLKAPPAWPESAPPAEAVAAKRAREIADLREKAAALGLSFAEPAVEEPTAEQPKAKRGGKVEEPAAEQ